MRNAQILRQVALIEEEMRVAGVWSFQVPDWVGKYSYTEAPDFWQWLQFVHLPLRASGVAFSEPYLAPQIRPFLTRSIPEDSRLVQRIVELDSLSSSIKKVTS